MAISLKTLDLYSTTDKKVVKFNVNPESETDELGNVHLTINLTHKDEVHRFSPNITDGELQRFAIQYNEENK